MGGPLPPPVYITRELLSCGKLFPIDRFLESFQAGGIVESDRDFTIDSLKARQKLGSNQLPLEGLWLVKLVQAAVSCEATSARSFLESGRSASLSRLSVGPGGSRKRCFDSFFQALFLPTEPFHLFAGLRSSLFEDTVRAEWTIRTGTALFRARFHEEGTEIEEEECYEKAGFHFFTNRPLRWPGFKNAAHLPVSQLLRRTANEFLAVFRYCWPCPIPLTVDGRPLEPRYVPSSLPSEGDSTAHNFSSAQSSVSPIPGALVRRDFRVFDGLPSLSIPWPADKGKMREAQFGTYGIRVKKVMYGGQTWLSWPLPAGEETGGVLFLLFGRLMESRVEFVCDGAVVDTCPLPWGTARLKVLGRDVTMNQFKVGVRVMLPVDHTELDLSHFGVRGKEEIVRDWEPRLRELLRETAEAVLHFAGEFKPRLAREPSHLVARAVEGYLNFVISIHPVFYYLRTYGFRKEVRSLLESLEEQ